MKIFVYEGAQKVPIAQPFIWNYIFELNIKLWSVSMSAISKNITLVGMFFLGEGGGEGG